MQTQRKSQAAFHYFHVFSGRLPRQPLHWLTRVVPMLACLVALYACQTTPASNGQSEQPSLAEIEEIFYGVENNVGEECSAYSLGARNEWKVPMFKIRCRGWEHSSGRVFQVPAAESMASLSQWAEQSWWRQQVVEQRAHCPQAGKPEIILGNVNALLLQCGLNNGGWPYLALVTRIGGSTYLADGIPAVLGVIEEAIGVLAGRLSARQVTGTGNAASRILQAWLGDRIYGAEDLDKYYRLMALGQYYNGVKDFAAAENQYREALTFHRHWFGKDNPESVDPLMHIALELSNQGRFEEADVLFAQVGAVVEQAPDRADYARYRSYLALHAANQGKREQALELAREATRLRRELAAGSAAIGPTRVEEGPQQVLPPEAGRVALTPAQSPNAIDVVQSQYIEAAMLQWLGQTLPAERVQSAAHNTLAAASQAPPLWQAQVESLGGRVTYSCGNRAGSERILHGAVALWQACAPQERPEALDSFEHGKTHQELGQPDQALEAFRTAIFLVKEHRDSLRFDQLLPYFKLMLDLAQARLQQRDQLYHEMFEAGQLIRSEHTSREITRAAVRLGAMEGPATTPVAATAHPAAKLVRELQNAEDERYFQHRKFALASVWMKNQRYPQRKEFAQRRISPEERQRRDDLVTVSSDRNSDPDQRVQAFIEIARVGVMDRDGIEALIDRDIKLSQRIHELNQQVQTALPAYNQLIDKPVKTEEVLNLLRPDEALVQLLLGDTESLLFLARKGQIEVHLLPRVGSQIIDPDVQALLSAIEQQSYLDVEKAHRLYRQLLGPVSTQLADVDHLIVVPTGSLLSLPFSLLVTAAPSTSSERPVASDEAQSERSLTKPVSGQKKPAEQFDYSKVNWLVKRSAISLAPSIRSFVDLRNLQNKKPSRAPKDFLGFGYPVPFNRTTLEQVKQVNLPEECRSESYIRDYHSQLAGLRRLEGAKRELETIVGAIPSTARAVFLGRDFNESAVEKNPGLQEYRIVYFATHTFLPVNPKCRPEPALVASLSEEPQEGEDGLIDAREILKLNLNADLVVLSACRTSAPGAEKQFQGESLSGLARAFFYAGARSMLVSHWRIPDEPTADLMIKVFRSLLGKEEGLAYALRRGQIEIMSAKSASHPYYWAAFSLVGDGARGISKHESRP